MFTERLKSLRKERNVTQTQLAKELNVSIGSVGNWETGARIPDIETFKILAEYFDVSVDYLLGRSEDKKIRPTEIDESDLSEREKYLLSLLRKVPDRDRPTVDRMIQALVQDEQ